MITRKVARKENTCLQFRKGVVHGPSLVADEQPGFVEFDTTTGFKTDGSNLLSKS